ncbi:MAG: hypothetical protein DRP09_07310 [Candidatus Thorarchaeota archaeon]|nr:MAG: hypothetical protein DRP09_07310 [Candidatus Thorarchaeota archaeon]
MISTMLLLSPAFSRECWMVVTLAGDGRNTEVSCSCGSLNQQGIGHSRLSIQAGCQLGADLLKPGFESRRGRHFFSFQSDSMNTVISLGGQT